MDYSHPYLVITSVPLDDGEYRHIRPHVVAAYKAHIGLYHRVFRGGIPAGAIVPVDLSEIPWDVVGADFRRV